MKKNEEKKNITSSYLEKLKYKKREKHITVMVCTALAVLVGLTTVTEMIRPAEAVTQRKSRTDNAFLVHMLDETEDGNVIIEEESQETEENDTEITEEPVIPENQEPAAETKEDISETEEPVNTETAENTKETETAEPEEKTVSMPAQDFYGKTEDLNITVYAPEGAFPEGTLMEVKAVYDEEVLNAAAGAAESIETKVTKVQAADITFRDAEGNDIEPLVPIQVIMTPAERLPEETETTAVYHIDDQGEAAEVELKEETTPEAVVFDAESFSVYALVYTVDFHWEVNGKTYDFSLPGGGYASLEKLMEVLFEEENEEKNEEEEIKEDEESVLTLEDITVSEETKKFVADIEKVEFSNPELVWIEKADADTTVGELKEKKKLKVEYSAELTEEQIEKINEQEIEAEEWAIISLKPFLSEETLTVTMKDGEQFVIKVTDGQLHRFVISDSGDKYEVIVTYDDKAGIPEGAELKVREILPEDTEYQDLRRKVEEKQLLDNPIHPIVFDISIYDGDRKIEPAEGSSVWVEIRLAKESISGVYTSNETPLLVNNEPFNEDEKTITEELKILHDTQDAGLETVKLTEENNENSLIGRFTTESFSNWLVFLDEEIEEITIGRGDTITLRPYSQWVWNRQNTVDGQSVSWKEPQTAGHMNVEKKSYTDDQLSQTYDYYQLTANTNPGDFYIETTAGKRIHVVVKGEEVSPVPDTINGLDTIKVNLFNYDLDHSLDVSENTAKAIEEGKQYASDGINAASALKFLGWGASNGSNKINNYQATSVTTGIVQNTLPDADNNKYPRLNGNGDTSLKYLFTPGNSDVDAHMGVTGLFRQDKDGYYYFNSNTNYAKYDSATNSFTLYEHTYTQKTTRNNQQWPEENSKPIGFFPFHEYDSNNDLSPNHNTNLDHHFGLSMEVKFYLPPDKKLHKQDGSTDDIIFEFSGDDDMWVFVDDNLALDMGGIHQPLTGNINFTNDPRFEGGKEYTLRIFYIERGGCDSNCSIKFNIPLKKSAFSFEKKDAEDKTFLEGAEFGLFKDSECKIPAVDDTNGKAYTAASDENGVVSFESVSIGTYYMRELKAPNGHRLDRTVRKVNLTETGVTIEGDDDPERTGVQINNQKNLTLTVEKKWQDQNGSEITPPAGASATFQVKRYVSHEEDIIIYDTPCTFNVYRSKNGQPKLEATYTFSAGTKVNVNWTYDKGYIEYDSSRKNKYKENLEDESFKIKPDNDPAVIALPDSGTANIYINDEDLNTQYDPGVLNISVSGVPYDPSGTEQHSVSDWSEDTSYTGPIINLPNDTDNPWKGTFSNLTVIEEKDNKLYRYKYYIVETVKTPTESSTVYVDGSGNVVSDPSTLKTDQDSTQTVINRITRVNLDIIKVDDVDYTHKLPGAIFTLRKIVENPTEIGNDITYDSSDPIVSQPTDRYGKTEFSSIQSGYYEIKETTVPTGYVLTGDGTFYIHISDTDVKLLRKDVTKKPINWEVIESGKDGMVLELAQATDSCPAKFTLINEPGASLPSTGGSGTQVIYLWGGLLVLGAGLFMIRRRKLV